MLRRSIKYLIIVVVNLAIPTVLLVLWTDELELTFNEIVRGIEIFKIAGFGILSVIGIGIVIYVFRRRKIKSGGLKFAFAVMVTLAISSYLYVDYSGKVIDHVMVNRKFRKQVADKIQPLRELAYGTTARNLTIEEYRQIRKICGFPELPSEASDIQYKYSYDGFLPDYSLELIYNLPVWTKVDAINYQNKNFSRYQSFEMVGDGKRVSYVEYEN